MGAAVQRADDLALVVHELGGALAPVRNAVDLLRAGGAGSAPDAARWLEIAGRGLARADRVLGNVLALAAPSAWAPATADVGVAEIFDAHRSEFAAEAAARGVDWNTDAPTGLSVRSDAGCLDQILVNLLSNAFKFTPRGGRVTLSATPVSRAVLPGRLTVLGGGFSVHPAYVRFAVQDTGIGLSVEARRRLYEPFYRAPEALALGASGMGLGLTVARRLTQLLHGDLRAFPVEGGGTRFVLTLPRDPATWDLLAAVDVALASVEARLAAAPAAVAVLRRDAGFAALAPAALAAGLQRTLGAAGVEVLALATTTWVVAAPGGVRALLQALAANVPAEIASEVRLHVQRAARGSSADECLLQALVRCHHRLPAPALPRKEADDATHPARR
jgi:hypothetical protein